ncbi:unnamed protein product [Clavelina lepadiformis]|uniref:RAD51 interacting motif domain-containing protein n=1 Tax=Clavelina lepadiformis TaxID=159417 RepID=A0ABP0G628_CLALP
MKPRRSRQTVDYSKFGKDDASDDDFETSTPPPVKKTKKESTSKKTSRKEPKARFTPDDQGRFKDELDRALELSLASSQNSNDSLDGSTTIFTTKAQICPPKDNNKENIKPAQIILPRKRTSENGMICQVDDKITEVEIPAEEELPRARSRMKSKNKDEEDNYVASDHSSSDNEEFTNQESDCDSDFSEEKKPSKPKRIKKEKKSSTKNRIKNKPSTNQKNTHKVNQTKKMEVKSTKTTAETAVPVSAKPRGTGLSKSVAPVNYANPILRKFEQPSWTPPGTSGSSPHKKLEATLTPTLRLGLSRNVRLKPLHVNVKPG